MSNPYRHFLAQAFAQNTRKDTTKQPTIMPLRLALLSNSIIRNLAIMRSHFKRHAAPAFYFLPRHEHRTPALPIIFASF